MEIDDLKKELVFDYFSEISKIPRGSGNERQISDYLVNEGKRLGLEVIQDEYLNVIIKKQATKGYQNATTVIIQGHMDMVCEKNKGKEHDFTKDPIELRVQDNYLYATDTTLGADNGIAVAMGLALLASNDIKHPPLEILFTADEEETMNGAMNLRGELFNGKYIINIDSEEEGTITVSCAGGVTAIVDIKKEYKSVELPKVAYKIEIKGLLGGHSGTEIDKQRANANVLMGRLLNLIEDEFDLVYIEGGLKNNAIPRESESLILINENNVGNLEKNIEQISSIFKNEYKTSDKNLEINLIRLEDKFNKSLSDKCKDSIILLINSMPRGIQTMSMDIIGLVESSTNLGVVSNNKENIVFEFASRSSVKSLKEDLNNRMKMICKNIGVKLDLVDDYPEWEYTKNSKLEEICVETYEKLTNTKPKIVAIHAGLECGLLLDAIKDAQAISIGPNLFDVHTPNEHLDIASTRRTWYYLVAILKNIK